MLLLITLHCNVSSRYILVHLSIGRQHTLLATNDLNVIYIKSSFVQDDIMSYIYKNYGLVQLSQ